MALTEQKVMGIARYLLDDDLNGERLHVHIAEVGPGERPHPPHQHGGLEALYILEGTGRLEIDGECQAVKANEAVVFDPQKLHDLVNSGEGPLSYLVVLAKHESQQVLP